MLGNRCPINHDLKHPIDFPHHHLTTTLWPGNPVTHPTAADKPVSTDPARLVKILHPSFFGWLGLQLFLKQALNWPFSSCPLNPIIFDIAPLQGLPVENPQIDELPAWNKVLFNKADTSLHLPLGLWSSDLTHLWHKTHGRSKVCKQEMTAWLSILFHPKYNSLYPVREHDLRNAPKNIRTRESDTEGNCRYHSVS